MSERRKTSSKRRAYPRGRMRRVAYRVLGLGRGRSWRRLAARWAFLGGLAFLLLLSLFVAVLYALADIPEPADIAVAQSARVVDAEGRSLGRISASADRVSIDLEDTPQYLRDAVVAVEDRRFWTHPGVSVTSIARAAITNVTGGELQGGSTITQQYVKNAFVGNERSIMRKMKEAVLALKLERRRTKEEILELYLNTIYLGRGAYGVQAAAQAYFGRSAAKLTLEQSAMLAGIIHAPEDYDPSGDPDEVKARRDTVLRLMAEQGMVSERERRDAAGTPIKAKRRRVGGIAPHFLEDVRARLERELGAEALYAGGVTVQVTLDLDMQRAAVRAIDGVYNRESDPEAVLVAIDPRTGAVRALVGARDFARRQLNIATRGRRQPGSTFKTMVLATAVDQDMPTTETYPAPATRTFDIDPEPWKVSNYDRAGHGRLTIRRATELSVNTVYAALSIDVGPEETVRTAHALGIASDLPPIASLPLGTVEVTPIELTSAYATLAGRGEYRRPFFVERVTDAQGEVLFEADAREGTRALEQGKADRVNAVLQGVIRRGTGASAQIGRPAAGKTGTTEDFNDAWFAGYTPDLAAVVWNGYAEGGKKLRDVRGRNVTGGSFPAQMWTAFMIDALEGVEPTPFEQPPPEPRDTPTAQPSPTTAVTPTATITVTTSPSVAPSTEPSSSATPTPIEPTEPTTTTTPSPIGSPSGGG